MDNIKFVSAENMETLEQYAAALVSAMITLRTLESFHIRSFSLGLLQSDEEETGKTICWELRRLMALYKTQAENVLGRTQLDEEMIINSLKALVPEVKKRKGTKRE